MRDERLARLVELEDQAMSTREAHLKAREASDAEMARLIEQEHVPKAVIAQALGVREYTVANAVDRAKGSYPSGVRRPKPYKI